MCLSDLRVVSDHKALQVITCAFLPFPSLFDFRSYSKMSCVISANQAIYQALIDKAASYPADKPYQANAYKNAAASILNYNTNIYAEQENDSYFIPIFMDIPGIGSKITNFINNFVKNNPQSSTSVTPVSSYPTNDLRRSSRVANKPAIKYFDENELIDDAIEETCDKYGWEFNDEMVNQFNTWLPTANTYEVQKYIYKTGKFVSKTKTELAQYWTRYYSKDVQEQNNQQKFTKIIIKYCQKNGIEYNPVMYQKFEEWKTDPANKKLVATYYYERSCNHTDCNPTIIERSCEHTPSYCVNKWFSTLKKIVVF